jgi:t-SNARE complex subunit (syntaxin)
MMFSLANKSIAQKTLAEMRDRQLEIKNIEKSVADLHQLFLEVQLVVNQQGDVLDRLETQMAEAEGVTDAAADEMHGAVEKKKSAQRKRWLLLILIIVILGIVGLVLGLNMQNK